MQTAFFSRQISGFFRPIPLLRCPTLCLLTSSSQCADLSPAWNSGMRDRSRAGDHLGALSLFVQMTRKHGVEPDRPTYLLLLKASAALSLHRLAVSVHAHVLKSGFRADVFVATALVDALSKCADIDGARGMFDEMDERDAASWNAMLSGYARHGCVHRALSLLREMGSCGMNPNSLTLSVLLQVCHGIRDTRLGRCIHAYAYRHQGLADTFLHNSLLVYHNKFGDVHLSENLFDRLSGRDIVSWNAMLSGYVQNGIPWRALEAFHSLREEGLRPDVVTFEMALQACAQIGEDAIDDGEMIHALVVKSGIPVDVYAENSLLLMYCKCENMESGQSLFDWMKVWNLVSWNILINGYIRVRQPGKAVALFTSMRFIESELSSDLLVNALQAVKLTGYNVKQVMSLHCLVTVIGFDSDVFVTSSLISAYGDGGEIEFACKCLDNMVYGGKGATVCWNTLLSVYAHQGYFSEAIDLVHLMQLNSCTLDAATLVNALTVCTQYMELTLGKAIHGYIIRNSFESDVFVSTSLLELYSRCGLLSAACLLFSKMPLRTLVSWNTMIHGCLQNGFPMLSLKLFHDMLQQEGLIPDATSVVGVIEAIAQRGYKTEANYIHEYANQSGLINVDFVANSLISMHARFHDFDKVNRVFERARKLGTVTWNAMIAEYSHNGLFDRGISIFYMMKINNVRPDSITLLCLLKACSGLGSLYFIMWIHAFIYKCRHEYDIFLATSLIDMYGKCGDLGMARLIFDSMESKTVVSWNSMMWAYGMHGIAEEASKLFSQMQQSGLNPTMVTFLILISACSHSGDVEKGQHYFDLMTEAYSFYPSGEHLSSFIDLLGRRGLVREAYEYLKNLPVDPGVFAWGSLLQGCRVHSNFELGLAVAEKLFELDPLHCGYYVLFSNMYADAGRWMDASIIRRKVEKLGLKKLQGWSIVEALL